MAPVQKASAARSAALAGYCDGNPKRARLPAFRRSQLAFVTATAKPNGHKQLARIHNLVPSALLVVVGAWAGAGRSLAALTSPGPWLVSVMSGALAVASVVVNDFFDFIGGVDAVNAPHKPIPCGAVAPDAALLLSMVLYMAVLCTACLMEPPELRCILAASAGATMLYTPLFKRVTAIKNAVVAAVIAAAPIAGALSTGVGDLALQRLLPAFAFLFSAVYYREVLMDLNDVDGDRAAHVWTIPVALGKPAALCVALFLLALGGALALKRAAAATPPTPATWLEPVGGAVGPPVLAVAAVLLRMAYLAVRVARSRFEPAEVGEAVEGCLPATGIGFLVLAALP